MVPGGTPHLHTQEKSIQEVVSMWANITFKWLDVSKVHTKN